ncbi:YwmB family TATA-box binding protein [Pontibacillus sp. ALD_SL1]|uniref:YwmB family TATA-box binding protein n=1 Tax=Pontibacillus sp. ALD_SL1 TaxID=2777185 RepID=UPI001A962869|nr:YwmB family TATA-box binding protein [Pontibacillus sp. ALD_SL1]QSS99826.1 YwmB family TATA-box binding protein [Pontibacillus sp. ALD_SL1]
MTHWEIVMKEQIQEKNLPTLMKQLKETEPNFTISKEDTETAKKTVVKNHQKTMVESEQFIVIVSKEAAPYAEIIYKMSGHTWDEDTAEFVKRRLNQTKTAYFQENTTIFTCVKADKNDKMNGVLLLEKFSTRLEIEKLQTITEPGFISVTGFTNEWNQALPYSDNGAMNVQYALRQGMGAKTTLIFGTPIITSEY